MNLIQKKEFKTYVVQYIYIKMKKVLVRYMSPNVSTKGSIKPSSFDMTSYESGPKNPCTSVVHSDTCKKERTEAGSQEMFVY